MPIKNLSSFFNHWIVWALISTLALGGALLNAWMGFPFPAPLEGVYSAVGGVIPYSDAENYLSGAHRFLDVGFLDSWNMRRPLNTLLLAFYLKITNFNFWYVIVLQMGVCVIALTLYLKTIRHELGILAAFVTLIFIEYYAQTYIQTTLSELLGLTLGLLSFVLLWNGWIYQNRFIYNAGMASLAVALSARAGPNFMPCAFVLLLFVEPLTQSRFKDMSLCVLSFVIPFFIMTQLSTFFGSPLGDGMAFSNFGTTLYGLVSGGKGWTYAYSDPHIKALFAQKSEAQQALILYEESWKTFKSNPLNLFIGMGKYLGAFFTWFLRRLTFGEGPIKIMSTTVSALFWLLIGFGIYIKRPFLNRAFLFLIIAFVSIAASSMIVFKDGGMRTFAVAIPFLGALISFACASFSPLSPRNTRDNGVAIGSVAFIFMACIMALYIPSRMTKPDLLDPTLSQIPAQETLLTYKLNKQPYLLINSKPGFHFRTISPNTVRASWFNYAASDESVGKELVKIVNGYKNNNLVLLHIYDYISHSSKWVLAENHILNINSDWIEIHVNLIAEDFNKIYKENSFVEKTQR